MGIGIGIENENVNLSLKTTQKTNPLKLSFELLALGEFFSESVVQYWGGTDREKEG